MFSVFIRVGGPSLFVLGVSQWESLVLASMQRSIRSSINFISCCLNKKTMSCREIQFNGIVLIYSNNNYRIWEYPINMHIVPTPPPFSQTHTERLGFVVERMSEGCPKVECMLGLKDHVSHACFLM